MYEIKGQEKDSCSLKFLTWICAGAKREDILLILNKHRPVKLLPWRLHHSLLLSMFPNTQAWCQEPCGPNSQGGWGEKTAGAPVLEASMDNRDFVSKTSKQASKTTPNNIVRSILLPAMRWEYCGRKEKKV